LIEFVRKLCEFIRSLFVFDMSLCKYVKILQEDYLSLEGVYESS